MRSLSSLLVISLSIAACSAEGSVDNGRDAGPSAGGSSGSGGSGGAPSAGGSSGSGGSGGASGSTGGSSGSSSSAGSSGTDAGANCVGVDPRAHGAVGDGLADDTEAFRTAATIGQPLCVHKTDAHYKLTGVVDLTASAHGVDEPEIRMYGATGEYFKHVIFAVDDYAGPGLTISGFLLDGQWDGTGANGEWSHNIQIRGSKNVTIENNVLKNPYGDNILLGGEWNPKPSENIVIRNNQMSGPRRCNIALIFAKNVKIYGNQLHKANDFVTAIDLEPNPYSDGYSAYESVWDVDITNNDFLVPNQVGVLLYHFEWGYPPDGLAGGNVVVSGNTGSALKFFAQVGNWVNVSVSNNSVQ